MSNRYSVKGYFEAFIIVGLLIAMAVVLSSGAIYIAELITAL